MQHDLFTTPAPAPKVEECIKEYSLKSEPSTIKIDARKISNSRETAETFRALFGDSLEIYESFYALFLNRNNTVTGWLKVSQGGIAGTVADPRLIFFPAVKTLASGIIIAHNHPSGALKASQADIAITKRLIEAGKTLEIQVLDHLILTADSYLSFADEGLI